ncbi:MAG: NUDIX domain-containing protein [Actinomycetota bacterium]
MARVRHERSAGSVILVPVGRQILVALIELRGGTVLALPKGHIEAGETPDETARRETMEETGLSGDVIAPLGDISYSFYSRERRARIAKRVAFYLLLYRSGTTARHNDEVEGVRLVPLEDAEEALSYRGEREVLARAAQVTRDLAAGAGRPAAKERQAPARGATLLRLGGLACTR